MSNAGPSPSPPPLRKLATVMAVWHSDEASTAAHPNEVVLGRSQSFPVAQARQPSPASEGAANVAALLAPASKDSANVAALVEAECAKRLHVLEAKLNTQEATIQRLQVEQESRSRADFMQIAAMPTVQGEAAFPTKPRVSFEKPDTMTSTNGDAKTHVDGEEEDEDPEWFEGSADAADLTNFYSFAMTNLEAVLARERLPAKYVVRLGGLLFAVVALVGIQLILAYGFYDAAIVLKVQATLDSFRDPLPFSFWYAHSIVEETHVSTLNCIASVCAIVLLGIYLKNDNEGTLITVCPLELLCLPRAKGAMPHVFSGGPLSTIGRLLAVLTAQACWTVRALLVPVLAGYGTVGAMLNSQNGQDIVLNSVAIGFVLELDEFIYDNLLGKGVKQRYEEQTLPPTSVLSLPSGSVLVTVYANLIYFLDLAFLLAAFFEEIYQPAHLILETMVEVDIKRRYDRLRICIMVRATALAIAQAHLAMDSARVRAWSRARLMGPVLVMMALSLLIAAAMYTLVLAGLLDGHLGCSFPNVMLSLRTMVCCVPDEYKPFIHVAEAKMGFDPDTCGKLDEVPGIFASIVADADAADANEYDNPMGLAWGHYPPPGYYMGHLMTNVLGMPEAWGMMRGMIPSIEWA